MILVDTNVISEPLRSKPNDTVVQWIDAQPVETLYLTAITVAELRYGIAVMADGKRRTRLSDGLEKKVLPLFSNRVLSFSVHTSKYYAELMASAKSAGLAVGSSDGMIAAIALEHKMSIATRDTTPFEAAGVTVINPWDS